MFAGVCPTAGFGQEGALQVGTQKPTAAWLGLGSCCSQHSQRLAQGGNATGHQGWADGFHTVFPKLIQQGQQLR